MVSDGMRPIVVLLGLAALLAGPRPALAVESYEACLSLIESGADRALYEAMEWADFGGGAAARHCAAMALQKLGRYAEAASAFEDLAQDRGAGDAQTRGEILAQAGNAWLLQHEPQKAFDAFSAALKLMPGHRDILIDRARAAALGEDYKAAAKDLDGVLAKAAGDVDALILRANARRALGNLKGALADAELAVAKGPAVPDAWLERGITRYFLGDKDGARADWRKTLKLAPDSKAALDAQGLLERDARGEALSRR